MTDWRPERAYIVSHTHWDREWYLSVQEFRVMLVRTVKGILDALESDGDFRHFVLDGQAICIDDYLDMCPEDDARIRRLAAEGKLSLGPWYILPDEFLVSAEATVRNLIIGHDVATRHGHWQRVGYMPDSFGHVAQMPQILAKSGIDSFIYTRGNGDEIDRVGTEFRWRAPDGSEVLAVNQVRGYCNAGGLGFREIWHAHTPRLVELDRAVEQVGEVFEEMGKRARTPIALLNNGCDHFPAQRDFGDVVRALRDAYPATEFTHTDFATFVEAVSAHRDELDVFEGEMVSGRLHHILSGVWSARMYLKQRNEACQNLLQRVVEPLAAYAEVMHGADPIAGQLTYLWKRLLENHPHDSICGCSTDEVHRDMIGRFDDVERSGEAFVVRTLQAFCPTFGPTSDDDRDTVLTIFNPLPTARTELIERMVILQPFGLSIRDLTLVDEAGNTVPFAVVDEQVVERFWGVDYRMLLTSREQRERFDAYRTRFASRILKTPDEADVHDTFVTIQFAASLPAVGHTSVQLVERASAPVPMPTVNVAGTTMSNDHVSVTLHDGGTFDVTDRGTGREFAGLNRLESEADVGDEYDFSPLAGTTRILAPEDASVSVLEDTGFRATLGVTFTSWLPAGVADDRSAQRDESVPCEVDVRVTLTHDSPRADVETTIVNRAHDHRLRAAFPTGLAAREVVSDGHFYVNRRALERDTGSDWVQPTPDTVPQQDYSVVEADGHGLVVLNRGLPEFAARDTGDGVTGYLTLLRAVGWLSRDDFESRRHSNAGPTLFTPEAQCEGVQRFRYAVTTRPSEAAIESDRYRTMPFVVQGVATGRQPGRELVRQSTPESITVSAIKPHRARRSIVVRLVNRTDRPIQEVLTFGRAVDEATRVTMLEEPIEPLEVLDRVVPVSLGPYAIETVEVSFA